MNSNRSTLIFAVAFLASAICVLSIPNPFYQHRLCQLQNISISDLTGVWYLTHHNNASQTPYQLLVTKQDNITLNVQYKSLDGTVFKSINLTRDTNRDKLEQIVNKGTFNAGLPWFIFNFEANKYATIFSVDENFVESYSILSRNKQFNDTLYDQATTGLKCAKLVDESGKPRIFKIVSTQ